MRKTDRKKVLLSDVQAGESRGEDLTACLIVSGVRIKVTSMQFSTQVPRAQLINAIGSQFWQTVLPKLKILPTPIEMKSLP